MVLALSVVVAHAFRWISVFLNADRRLLKHFFVPLWNVNRSSTSANTYPARHFSQPWSDKLFSTESKNRLLCYAPETVSPHQHIVCSDPIGKRLIMKRHWCATDETRFPRIAGIPENSVSNRLQSLQMSNYGLPNCSRDDMRVREVFRPR